MIRLYCTNRCRHQRADLCEVHPDGDQRVTVAPLARRPEYRLATAGGPQSVRPWAPDDQLVLPCVRCRRRPVWSQQRARAIHDGAVDGGMTELDLSYLD